MIAKAIKGKGFRGALEYDLKKEQGRIIDTNMDGRSPRELAAEFGEIRRLRLNLSKVVHVSLAASQGDLTYTQQVKISQPYIKGTCWNQNNTLCPAILTSNTDIFKLSSAVTSSMGRPRPPQLRIFMCACVARLVFEQRYPNTVLISASISDGVVMNHSIPGASTLRLPRRIRML
jgi:hypothetical protein